MNGSPFASFPQALTVVHSRFFPAPRGTKQVVVLLPAFPFSTSMWEPMLTEFHKIRKDTAFLLVDFPGFGNSTLRQQWDFSSFALELRGVIEQHTRRSIILGGLSMGGYAAFEFYRLHKDIVKALVLSNTRAESDSQKEQSDRSQFAEEILATGAEAIIKRNYPNFVTEKTEVTIATQIRNWIFEAEPAAAASAQKVMANRRDSLDLLPNIPVPTLVIASENDRITRSTTMRKMAKAIPNSSFIELKDSAHLSAVEKPEEWAKLLAAFLDTL